MQRKEELREIMNNKNVSVAELAEKIGIDTATMYRKLAQDGESITIKEARKIVDYLKIPKGKAVHIFFD